MDFIMVPIKELKECPCKLSSSDKLVYAYIYTCIRNMKQPRHYLSGKQIGSELGMPQQRVSESVKRLRAAGLITTEKKKDSVRTYFDVPASGEESSVLQEDGMTYGKWLKIA